MYYDFLKDISEELLIEARELPFVRSNLLNSLEPPKQMVTILKGARGIGKSTLLQQYLAQKHFEGHKVLYVSADAAIITDSISALAFDANKRGVQYLALDEIHKVPNWEKEVKTIVDSFPKMKLLVSGSSSLSLNHKIADLSRRHIMLRAKGLSFREYIEQHYQISFTPHTLVDILENAEDIAANITREFQMRKLDLLEIFHIYLREGYFMIRDKFNNVTLYYDNLINTVNLIIESDLPNVYPELDGQNVHSIKSLLKHIAHKCPFTPNIQDLTVALGIPKDNTVKKYLQYLHDGEVIFNLYHSDKFHVGYLKPQKIFLSNPNYAYAFAIEPNIGTIRETYVANCLMHNGELTAPTQGDFCLNNTLMFEVGGKSKTKKQLNGIKNSYVLADNTLLCSAEILPLWLLGFLW